jgi:uncharacterized membrane protein
LVIAGPVEAAAPAARRPAPSAAPAREARGQVRVSAQVNALLASLLGGPAEPQAPAAGPNLDAVVHGLLIVGLAISSLLMLTGLALDVVLRRQIPTAIPNIAEVFARLVAGRPSGFLSLGLLVLIATPIVRVIGSMLTFVYERDWRYAVISTLVLLIVGASLLLGRG